MCFFCMCMFVGLLCVFVFFSSESSVCHKLISGIQSFRIVKEYGIAKVRHLFSDKFLVKN